ncbi:lipoxygenase 3, Arabidopsis thaliana lipoxygenase 3 [Hibiscus trionum]|uniref:Lipoxygenase 3, Arabidopsis thaliana lipoxygenase 3 n=1 Tax=Hibiscus trionum TaxID=183268 RepID=A0A9W7M762_HIBTR|nr:lipoxygenase 3, Arabidopsis thaliana lipoxygenase 3 [Hibiscus trionum]
MALAKEMMGCSLIQRSSFVSSSKVFLNCSGNATCFRQRQNRFPPLPAVHLRKVFKTPVVAAVSEDLIKALPNHKEKAVEFKVRAAVTIRNKNKEDFKKTLVKHFDAFTDMLGRNVVLEQ